MGRAKEFLRRFGVHPGKMFGGYWPERLVGLFDCGVDYRGKRLLDAGCNMGIIAYEIAKEMPAHVHGVDHFRSAVGVARKIFAGVPVPSRWDAVDLTNDRKLRRCLEASYDIVMLLGVYQHIREQNVDRAQRMIRTLGERCRETMMIRTKEEYRDELAGLLGPLGFAHVAEHYAEGRKNPLLLYSKAPLPKATRTKATATSA